MNSWIDLHALWQIVVLGVVAGAGLPAVFAVGLRVLSVGQPQTSPGQPAPVGAQDGTRGPLAIAGAGLCFAIVLAAVAWGIYFIVAGT